MRKSEEVVSDPGNKGGAEQGGFAPFEKKEGFQGKPHETSQLTRKSTRDPPAPKRCTGSFSRNQEKKESFTARPDYKKTKQHQKRTTQ